MPVKKQQLEPDMEKQTGSKLGKKHNKAVNGHPAYKLNKQSIRQYTALTCSFPNLEPVCFSMSGLNCCFLTCIQVSQKVGKVVWYSHLIKNFPQIFVIHTLKGFGIDNKAEVDAFLELLLF